MKKYLIIIGFLIIVAILAGGIWYWQKQKRQLQQISNTSTQQDVTINIQKNEQLERLIPVQLNATTSIFEITERGGIIFSTDDQMQMEIPEGAVTSTTRIMIAAGSAWGPFGEGYSISPVDVKIINFLKPATIKISYDFNLLPEPLNEKDLTISIPSLHGFWEDVTTTIDIVNHILITTINSIKQTENYQIRPYSCPPGQYWNGDVCVIK